MVQERTLHLSNSRGFRQLTEVCSAHSTIEQILLSSNDFMSSFWHLCLAATGCETAAAHAYAAFTDEVSRTDGQQRVRDD